MIIRSKLIKEVISNKTIKTIKIMIFGICHKIKIIIKRKNSLYKIQGFGLIRKM